MTVVTFEFLDEDEEFLRGGTAECLVCQPQEKHEVYLKCFHILLHPNCLCLSEHLNHALPVSFSGPLRAQSWRALTSTNEMELWKNLEKTQLSMRN